MSDLDVLFPEGKTVEVQGESLVIKPYTFGQIAKVSKLAYPIIAALVDTGLLRSDTVDGKTHFSVANDWMLRIVEIMGIGGEDLLQLVALSVGKPRVWLDSIQLDEGVSITQSVIEVNSDFFAKRILPKLPAKATESPASDGDTSLPNLSETATADETLTDTP